MFKRWRRRPEPPRDEPELHGTRAVAFLLPKDPDDGSTWEASHWEPESEGGAEPSGEWVPEDQFPDWTVIYLADDLPSGRRR